MTDKKLVGKRIAVLVDMGFEEVEMTEPVKALKEAGANVFLISKHPKVRAWRQKDWGSEYNADVMLDKAEAYEYDALLLPGGVMNPDKLRMNPLAVEFVKYFMESGKPIAAICHGPWTLIETGLLEGRELTSYPSLKTDLKNAGAIWIDKEVVVQSGLVTSRNPNDIPAFNKKMIEEFSEGIHVKRKNEIEKEVKGRQRSPVKNEGRLNENIDTRNWDEVNNERDPRDDF
jgi:protease I